ncbi:MAG: GNAT family N-acetyltransferase [Lysobacterales bacterium]|nr:MAG: GNAT family N-acetyltransferase [Xanthomonadales bacterium]
MQITYQQEPGGPDLVGKMLEEALPMFKAHYEEIAKFKDIPLDIDIDAYLRIEKIGRLRVFTVRDDGVLIGYAIFTVGPHPHYNGHIHAMQDILYLKPEYRKGRIGQRLISFSDEKLEREGVDVVFQHVKVYADFGGLLEMLGYEKMDTIWAKRLNKPDL